MLFNQVGENAEIAVGVGIAGAGLEMRRARLGQQRACILTAEDTIVAGALKHRQRPVVAKSGLVVTEMGSGRALAFEQGEIGVERGVELLGTTNRVQQHRAG